MNYEEQMALYCQVLQNLWKPYISLSWKILNYSKLVLKCIKDI